MPQNLVAFFYPLVAFFYPFYWVKKSRQLLLIKIAKKVKNKKIFLESKDVYVCDASIL
jgi:hypothetical protein